MNDSASVALGPTLLVLTVLIVLVFVWSALALAAVFRKAGEEGWKGWVPVLNIATVLKLGGLSPWLVLIGLVPLFGAFAFVVVFVVAAHRIGRSFGFGAGMTVLAALLTPVWASVLGFGSAEWIAGAAPGPVRTGSSGPSRVGPDVAASGPRSSLPHPASGPAPVASGPVASGPVASGPVASGPVAWGPPAAAAASPAPAPAVGPPPAPATTAIPVVEAAPAFPPPPPPLPRRTPTPVPPGGLPAEPEDDAVDPEDRLPVPSPAAPTVSSTPPERTPAPQAGSAPPVPIASVPGIVSSAPAAPRPAPEAAVAAPPPASPAAPVSEPWAPVPTLRPPAPAAPDDAFPEPSEAVSAVAGSPDAGSPRAARSSVSALYARPEIPGPDEPEADADDLDADDLDGVDQTVIARRRRIPWTLVPPGGTPVDLSSDVVILGRRPAADPAYPGAQLVSISDETRTVSKTHARLELRHETWYVTDLGSTNGVLFATFMGTEVEAPPGQEIEAGERFFLGDAEVRLTRSEG